MKIFSKPYLPSAVKRIKADSADLRLDASKDKIEDTAGPEESELKNQTAIPQRASW